VILKTMKSESRYKIPGGKLLRVFLEYSEDTKTIQDIRITGDFFVYPEEAIEELESILLYTPIIEEDLKEKISRFIETNDVTLVGLTSEDLVKGIMMCVSYE